MLNSHLERVLGKIDDLDASNLTILVQRLLQERNLLEAVFNTIKEGVFVINDQWVIEYANRSACHLFGLTEKEVGNAFLWKVVPDVTKSIKINLNADGLTFSLMEREIEVTYPEHRYFQIYMLPLGNQGALDANHNCFALIFSDITEQKQHTKRALEQERFSSIFMLAAGVAHELGNPLNSINIHLQLIERYVQTLGPSTKTNKIQQSLEVCINEVQRLDGIIRHFLEAVRPTSPAFEDLNLSVVIQEVLAFQRQELADLNVQIIYELPPELPAVAGDKNQMKQVFFNLIKNASEAMDGGGTLKISAVVEEAHLYLYIADTGSGIEYQDLPNIFEAYYTTKQRGSGLGLMIVERIMREHAGSIGIDSQAGMGTVVTLQLPLKYPTRKLLNGGSEP